MFGYGEAGKKFAEQFRNIKGYGTKFRIHMVQVSSLRDFMPAVALNSKGQWKFNDEFFEDENLGLSFGDDLEWLRESGWEGHDVILNCSDEGDYFAEEIEYQVNKDSRMKLYECNEIEKVDALIEELKTELAMRADLYGEEIDFL